MRYTTFSNLPTLLPLQQEWSVPTAGLSCKKASLFSVGVVVARGTWYVTSSLNSVEIILWDFAAVNTTELVVEIRPEKKIQGRTGFEPMTSAEPMTSTGAALYQLS